VPRNGLHPGAPYDTQGTEEDTRRHEFTEM
jgi:hypothetical protein